MVKNYREAFGLYAVNGILFNHTSPRRGENFVCKKITMGVAAIKAGKQDYIALGNLNSFRDLGHAKDYIIGMWKMLQKDTPKDYVLSMKYGYTIRELVEMAFNVIGVKIKWQGSGLNEIGVNSKTGDVHVIVNPKYFRPAEVEYLNGDSSLARSELDWIPSYKTEDIIKEMVEYDLMNLKT